MSRPGPGLALSQIIYEQYHRARQQYLRPREDAEPQTRAASGGAVRERLDEEQQQQPIASAEEAAAVVTLAQHTDDRHTLWAQIAPKLVMLHHMQREKTLSIADGDSRAAGGTQERARLEEVVRVLLSHYGELFMRVHSISEEALEQGEFMTRPPMTPMLADVLQRLRHHHHRHRQQDWQDMVNGMSLNGDEGHVIHEQEAGLAHKDDALSLIDNEEAHSMANRLRRQRLAGGARGQLSREERIRQTLADWMRTATRLHEENSRYAQQRFSAVPLRHVVAAIRFQKKHKAQFKGLVESINGVLQAVDDGRTDYIARRTRAESDLDASDLVDHICAIERFGFMDELFAAMEPFVFFYPNLVVPPDVPTRLDMLSLLDTYGEDTSIEAAEGEADEEERAYFKLEMSDKERNLLQRSALTAVNPITLDSRLFTTMRKYRSNVLLMLYCCYTAERHAKSILDGLAGESQVHEKGREEVRQKSTVQILYERALRQLESTKAIIGRTMARKSRSSGELVLEILKYQRFPQVDHVAHLLQDCINRHRDVKDEEISQRAGQFCRVVQLLCGGDSHTVDLATMNALSEAMQALQHSKNVRTDRNLARQQLVNLEKTVISKALSTMLSDGFTINDAWITAHSMVEVSSADANADAKPVLSGLLAKLQHVANVETLFTATDPSKLGTPLTECLLRSLKMCLSRERKKCKLWLDEQLPQTAKYLAVRTAEYAKMYFYHTHIPPCCKHLSIIVHELEQSVLGLQQAMVEDVQPHMSRESISMRGSIFQHAIDIMYNTLLSVRGSLEEMIKLSDLLVFGYDAVT